jgi:hypothetical protein
MPELLETLNHFETVITQSSPRIANRLQSGLTRSEIEAKTASFSWELPQEAFDLYQWHNGLSGQPGKLNLVEKFIRIKGKWHGELSGRENEARLKLSDRLIVAKFLPLDYALAGHRHLKMGRCLVDLLPLAILIDGEKTTYCMMRLEPKNSIVYCADGTQLPPMKVTESFLSTQPQFSQFGELIAFLGVLFEQGIPSAASNLEDSIDCELSSI